jgi:hypothetical protein
VSGLRLWAPTLGGDRVKTKSDTGCFLSLIIVAIVVVAFVPHILGLPMFTQAWYSFRYGVPWESVEANPKPTGCDFSRAPIGGKACHYDKVVTVMPLGTENGTGRRVISLDNGKTSVYPDKDHPSVVVSWDRVEDP